MLESGNIINFENGKYIKSLENKVYSIEMNSSGDPVLKIKPSFLHVNLSGENKNIANLIISHYEKTKNNFGVVLEGCSGMGKTQVIKYVCNVLQKPVLLVNDKYSGGFIKSVLDNVDCDCILVFDEFEKIYNKPEDSDSLLNIFDGLDTKNRVFSIVSINNRKNLSNFFFGRPGRFIFKFNFNSLKLEDAIDFITNEITISDPSRLKSYLSYIANLSYDICDKICQLISIHGEDCFIANSKYFNITTVSGVISYKYIINGVLKKSGNVLEKELNKVYFTSLNDHYNGLSETSKNIVHKSSFDEELIFNNSDLDDVDDTLSIELHIKKILRNSDEPIFQITY